jgi:hypothetical protein
MRQQSLLTVHPSCKKAASIDHDLSLNSIQQVSVTSVCALMRCLLRRLVAKSYTDYANVFHLTSDERDTKQRTKASPVPLLVKHVVVIADRALCVFFHSEALGITILPDLDFQAMLCVRPLDFNPLVIVVARPQSATNISQVQ